MNLTFTHRLAQREDIPSLQLLMAASVRELLRDFLSPEAVEASFDVMGLDTQLIDDGTYYVIECDTVIVGRDVALLDPQNEAARVRAMYTNPQFTRYGIGRLLLGLCEQAAAAEGFQRVTLAATMAGELLYRACGYQEMERFEADTSAGVPVPLVRMGKWIGSVERTKLASSQI